ncbi:glutathione synthase/RimK-type ligase-like ATP-grasp enzyme [Paenibacillus sp. PastF-3]|uniref:YheC/YheD family endospore coat-associated protein n=1 Tax=Paenibacillus sp. PastF-3 TaxID=2940626 RepID=UPI0024751360|nr:YheC/YheD family protein [Paenibacillus sp. PastF-3]MDH6370593.1 glutathione synthase/RimK-type ligase-like ATP-grasp enzyme [Paenibacillus sp. PastF-3]
MTETAMGFLGIMTGRRHGNPPIAEPEFCSHLCRAAPRYNLKVLVFHPDGVAADGSSITGYTWKDGSWHHTTSTPPDIIYNRCFYNSPKERKEASSALSFLHRSLPWSRGLPDKWGVYEILKRNRRAAILLPETVLYTGTRKLSNMLAEREYGVFLKPKAGSHGKRTLHAIMQNRRSGGGIRVRGRDGTNTPFQYVFSSQDEGLNWIHEFIGTRRYIIQPYLHLTNREGQPFDVRVLMQKNGLGRWDLTGMAVRLGNHGSLTSNLHGGGTAVPPLPFLLAEYGQDGKDIMQELATEAAYLPPLLEAACGRLGELGLDFGIDSSGRIHLLEANSKPGRTVFRLTGDRRAAKLAAENPLSYARHLLLTQRRIPSLSTDSSVINGRMITMVPKEDS